MTLQTTIGYTHYQPDETDVIGRILEVTKLLEKTGNEDKVQKFAYENVKQLYPDLTFPESAVRDGYAVDERAGGRLLTIDERYILDRVASAYEKFKGVKLQHLYMGFQNRKNLEYKSKNTLEQLLKDLTRRNLLYYDQQNEIAYSHKP